MAHSRWRPIVVKECAILVYPSPSFETVGSNNITIGSPGDIGTIHTFSDFDLWMTPCDLERFLGGGGFSRTTI